MSHDAGSTSLKCAYVAVSTAIVSAANTKHTRVKDVIDLLPGTCEARPSTARPDPVLRRLWWGARNTIILPAAFKEDLDGDASVPEATGKIWRRYDDVDARRGRDCRSDCR